MEWMTATGIAHLKQGLPTGSCSKKRCTLENNILLRVASWNNNGATQI